MASKHGGHNLRPRSNTNRHADIASPSTPVLLAQFRPPNQGEKSQRPDTKFLKAIYWIEPQRSMDDYCIEAKWHHHKGRQAISISELLDDGVVELHDHIIANSYKYPEFANWFGRKADRFEVDPNVVIGAYVRDNTDNKIIKVSWVAAPQQRFAWPGFEPLSCGGKQVNDAATARFGADSEQFIGNRDWYVSPDNVTVIGDFYSLLRYYSFSNARDAFSQALKSLIYSKLTLKRKSGKLSDHVPLMGNVWNDYVENMLQSNNVDIESKTGFKKWCVSATDAEQIFQYGDKSYFRRTRSDESQCYLGGDIKFSFSLTKNRLSVDGVVLTKSKDGTVDGKDCL